MSTILHVDMDAFFAAVEQHDHPEWRGKPVVVGAPPDQRGVVAAASYEARAYGIHSAMPSREAGRRCPLAVFVPVNGKRYQDVSRQVFAIFERFTPLVEPVSIDEAFLDVTGAQRLFGDGVAIAKQVKAAVLGETGLTASVGLAPNKFLAKLASDMDKPDGLTLVPERREDIVKFLAPLPVSRIWGVGKVTQAHLESAGVRTVGQLQATPERQLVSVVGRHSARHLRRLAFGEDAREIELDRKEKSMSREHTFAVDCESPAVIYRTLGDLVEDVGRRLREAAKYASVAHLKLRWEGFETVTRQKPFIRPCCDDFSLREAAEELLTREELVKAVRLIGFGVSGLRTSPHEQLSLFEGDALDVDRKERLSRTVDAIRRRHGSDSIGRAGSETSG